MNDFSCHHQYTVVLSDAVSSRARFPFACASAMQTLHRPDELVDTFKWMLCYDTGQL